MKIKKFMTLALALSLSLVLASCSGDKNKQTTDEGAKTEQTTETENKEENKDNEDADQTKEEEKENASETPEGETVKVTMVTDFGGVNDKSFNQSAYEGLQKAQDDGIAKFDYIESHKEADYKANLESALDSESDIILTVGYALYKDTVAAAKENPDKNYVIIDSDNQDKLENLVGVGFADHQNSFLVGYIAGMMTESKNVGFVGGVQGDVIDRFEYGYRAGVAYAAKERGEDIEVQVQYANSFSDQAAGKNIAERMYQQGADVVFHAAGGVGIGVIEAAKESNKWVIGVDRDQQAEAPDNMLVSTIKGVGDAVRLIVEEYQKGDFKGGETVRFTLADDNAVSIAYADNGLVKDEIKEKVEQIKKDIIDGKIEVPQNKEEAISQGWIEEEK
ncbi:BMP family lipoprotein [Anaerococcus sp. Marseille-P9784]|uniref:BMP family lipoprotein n=1 Tax=Anaerococcus sp. Marseille-P9784 TaxID=2614127 RepID=UPI00124A516A|nr:BMP family ABC transporter substrate-binding protein [Anaerococcus sp. Marseille-P9784]